MKWYWVVLIAVLALLLGMWIGNRRAKKSAQNVPSVSTSTVAPNQTTTTTEIKAAA